MKEDDISGRFHDKLQKVGSPSHSLSVSLSLFQVVLHTTSAPPRWLLHENIITVPVWGAHHGENHPLIPDSHIDL